VPSEMTGHQGEAATKSPMIKITGPSFPVKDAEPRAIGQVDAPAPLLTGARSISMMSTHEQRCMVLHSLEIISAEHFNSSSSAFGA